MANHNEECPDNGFPNCLGQLARMEAKIDILCADKADKENRIRALEDDRSQRKGAGRVLLVISGALGGLMGAASSWALSLLTKPTPHP